MYHKLLKVLVITALMSVLLAFGLVGVVSANEPDPWLTLVEPLAGPPADDIEFESRAAKTWADWREHHTGPNPRAYQKLMLNEAKALAAGKSPQSAGLDVISGTEHVLVFLIEFNPEANDVFTNFVAPDYDGVCHTMTLTTNGPLHGQMEQPGPRDNNTLWLEDFPVSYYEEVVFGDGSEEITIRGADHPNAETVGLLSMAQYYEENSRGMLAITGTVFPQWIQLPHSEAWYGAAACAEGRTGMSGHPDNDLGVQQAVIDAVDTVNELDPDFDWESFDQDGDGIVDHLVVVKAGPGAESGAFVTDTMSIWSHSSDVMPAQGGYTATEGIVVMNYTMQPENVEVGVLAHEFGHDLGLPDYYDTSGGGESDVVWWDIMSTGSHTGPGAIGTMPTHLSSFNKWLFGWNDPLMITETTTVAEVDIGQISDPPEGTEDAVFVMLPDQVGYFAPPHSGHKAWWSNFDVAWGDARLATELDLTGASGTVSMTYWLNYAIEEDWDFLFVEASTDGENWAELKAYDVETGEEVTTPDDYGDPNGRMIDFGHKKYGISGESHGWVELYSDLSGYAGETVQIRFRYCTDAGFQMDGAMLDDVAVPATGWSDDMEGDVSDWTLDVSSFAGAAPGAGWELLTDGEKAFPHFFIAEWRNFDGFDEGLKYTYQTWLYDDLDEWAVDKIQANAPGMLVWYRNGRYQDNHITGHAWDAPSSGSKGGLLLVDSHFYPYVRPYDNGEFGGANLAGRPQSTDLAFTLHDTYPFDLNAPVDVNNQVITTTTYPVREAVSSFSDSQGYFPGLGWLYWVDGDASVVVPSVGNQVYSTRIVEESGEPPLFDYAPATGFYGIDLWGDGLTILGSGNPGDDNLQFGWNIDLLSEAEDSTSGHIRVYNQVVEFETTVDPEMIMMTKPDEYMVTYQTVVKNTGSSPASNLAMTYTLDSHLNLVSLTGDGWREGSVVVPIGQTIWTPDHIGWEAESLLPGEVVTVTLVATGTMAAPLTDLDLVTTLEAFDGAMSRGPWYLGTTIWTPMITFATPADGAEIEASGVTTTVPIEVGTVAFDIPDDGYWMLAVDDIVTPTMVSTYTTSVPGLALGTHTFTATLFYSDGTLVLGTDAQDSTTFEIVRSGYELYLPLITRNYTPAAASR